jgi:hypothetical protein
MGITGAELQKEGGREETEETETEDETGNPLS